MSPLWREQVQVLVTPASLTFVRFSRGLRPVKIGSATVPVIDHGAKGMPNWTSALVALAQVLTAEEWRHGDLSIVLSNHFMRYQVVPWRDELRDESELIGYVRQLMSGAYGRRSADWSVEISIDGVGQPCVGSAVDIQLIHELQAIATHQGRRLVSVRPLLMEAFNWAKAWLKTACQWLVIVEDGMICAALVGHGRWVVVRTCRTGSDWPAELVAMLEREQFLVDEAESAQTVLLHVVNGEPMELPANQWTVRHLRTDQPSKASASVLSCVL